MGVLAAAVAAVSLPCLELDRQRDQRFDRDIGSEQEEADGDELL
jgi:hypothetical protein